MQSGNKPIKSIQLEYNGVRYDCLLEIKYTILIENEYSFLYHPLKIHYDPATLEPISYLKENAHYYPPDFLVRRWSDNKAFLVEVKDLDNEGASEKIAASEIISNKYILQMGFDWEFKKMLKNDIQSLFTPEHLKNFMKIRNTKETYDFKRSFEKIDKKFRQSSVQNKQVKPTPCFIKGKPVSKEQLKLYLWKGIIPDFSDR